MATALDANEARRLVRRVSVSPLPADAAENASFTLSYTASVLDYIEKTIDGVTYRKTLTWTGSDLTAVSAWVAQ